MRKTALALAPLCLNAVCPKQTGVSPVTPAMTRRLLEALLAFALQSV
jgi:hypothetical protein